MKTLSMASETSGEKLPGDVANTGSKSVASTIGAGDKLPADVELHQGFPPSKVNMAEYVKGKKLILIGLPGAFTPT